MAIKIDEKICTGCGTCIDACAFEAIQLIDGRAQIDHSLCTLCEACLSVCPNGAIVDDLTASSEVVVTQQPTIQLKPIVHQKAIIPPVSQESTHGIKSLAGAALSFLGSEVAPRVIDVVIKSIEQRLAQPASTTLPPSPASSKNYNLPAGGQRKQTRYRGGKRANRKSRGRR